MAGDLPPGSQLPSTTQLMQQYEAANATIQNALSALKAEGFLHSHAGKGVYVRDRQPLVVEVAAYVAPAVGDCTYQLVEVDEVRPPVEVARALGLVDGESVVMRKRLLLRASEPVEVSWSYYPASIARGTELAKSKKITGGAPRVLTSLGHPLQEFVDRLSVRMPTTEEAETLQLPQNVPVIRQFRIMRSVGDRPIEVSILIKGGHLYELQYQQQVQSEGS